MIKNKQQRKQGKQGREGMTATMVKTTTKTQNKVHDNKPTKTTKQYDKEKQSGSR